MERGDRSWVATFSWANKAISQTGSSGSTLKCLKRGNWSAHRPYRGSTYPLNQLFDVLCSYLRNDVGSTVFWQLVWVNVALIVSFKFNSGPWAKYGPPSQVTVLVMYFGRTWGWWQWWGGLWEGGEWWWGGWWWGGWRWVWWQGWWRWGEMIRKMKMRMITMNNGRRKMMKKRKKDKKEEEDNKDNKYAEDN